MNSVHTVAAAAMVMAGFWFFEVNSIFDDEPLGRRWIVPPKQRKLPSGQNSVGNRRRRAFMAVLFAC